MKAFIVFKSIDYEDSYVLSVFSSLEAANSACEKRFQQEVADYYDEWCIKSSFSHIEKDGTFYGSLSDSNFYVEIHEVQE